jgi:hypothetical protein
MSWSITELYTTVRHCDRLCDLVVKVPGYRSRGDLWVCSQDFRRYQIVLEVVERGPLSIVNLIEELLEWKISGSGSIKSRITAVGIRCADHATSSLCKDWH